MAFPMTPNQREPVLFDKRESAQVFPPGLEDRVQAVLANRGNNTPEELDVVIRMLYSRLQIAEGQIVSLSRYHRGYKTILAKWRDTLAKLRGDKHDGQTP